MNANCGSGLAATGSRLSPSDIAMDRISGQPRGFGFVEMSEDLAVRCVMACNGQDFLGGRW